MNKEYEVNIGLEIHAELSTKSKIFCACENKFGAKPNTLCCPICSGMPGALPVINECVIEYAVKTGCALNCKINNVSKFDRKNYFYPDLPKAYQISQFDVPLCENGFLNIFNDGEIKKINIERIHIEEDAGKLVHSENSQTYIDYNRSGVPLIEIVTMPDMKSAQEAKIFMEDIASVLQYLDVSSVEMQEGNMRADVNISLRNNLNDELGTRTEMKNINSFGAVYRSINYEIKRQSELLQKGETIKQETRRWDDFAGESQLLRSKENAYNYRFFQEPDLLFFEVTHEKVAEIKKNLPELAFAKMQRYLTKFEFSEANSRYISQNPKRSAFFDEAVKIGNCEAKIISNWLLGDIARLLAENKKSIEETELTPKKITEMIMLVDKGEISNTAAKKVLEKMFCSKASPAEIIFKMGLSQIDNLDILSDIVLTVINDNEQAVEDYESGKTNVMSFLVGQCMKESKGKANPTIIKQLLLNKLR